MKNIFGVEVKPKQLFIKQEGCMLILFRGKSFYGMVAPNGWNGKSMMVNFPKGEPILTTEGSISLSEVKSILNAWENRKET